jgi:hypothetical protein
MKILLSLFFFICCIRSTAQSKIVGHYQDYSGCALDIYPDSTFYFSWHFDLQASWTKGVWKYSKDTVHLKMIPIYDTATYGTKENRTFDSLILSLDTIPERIAPPADSILYSGGQNIYPYPTKLLFRKNRLYYIDDRGRLRVKWQRGFWSGRHGKRFPPWLVKRHLY